MSSLELSDSEIKSVLAEVSASLQAAAKSDAEALAKKVQKTEDLQKNDSGLTKLHAAMRKDDVPPTKEESPSASSSPAAPEAAEPSPPASPEMSAGDGAPPAPEGMHEGSSPGELHPDGMGDEDMGAPDMGGDEAEVMPGYSQMDPGMLQAECDKLPDEDLKALYMAVKACVFERMHSANPADQDPAAAMKAEESASASSGSASSMAKEESSPAGKGMLSGTAPKGTAHAPTSLKSEGNMLSGTADKGKAHEPTAFGKQNLDGPAAAKGGPGADLSHKQIPKSQPDLSNEVAKEVAKSESKVDDVEDLKAQVAGLTRVVDLLTQPMRKAVTSVAYLDRVESLNKTEEAKKELSPAEMKSKLSDMIRGGKLSKAEKNAVTDYFETKNPVHLNKIAHLFK